MCGCLVLRRKHPGGLNYVLLSGLCTVRGGGEDIDGILPPGDVGGVALAIDFNVLAIDHQLAVLSVDVPRKTTVGGVVLEHVHPTIIR
jgi:hypothetical protein